MNSVGPWIMAGIGVLGTLASIYCVVVQRRHPILMLVALIIGGLLVGVGIYGPGFMGPYTDFIKVVLPMVKTPSTETYLVAFDRTGKGDFDPALQEITLSYALDRPITNMDSLLTEAINSATNDQGRSALEEAKRTLAGKSAVAERLANTVWTMWPNVVDIEKFDPVTRMLVAKKLLANPPRQEHGRALASGSLSTEQLKEKLKQWAQPRPTMAEVSPLH